MINSQFYKLRHLCKYKWHNKYKSRQNKYHQKNISNRYRNSSTKSNPFKKINNSFHCNRKYIGSQNKINYFKRFKCYVSQKHNQKSYNPKFKHRFTRKNQSSIILDIIFIFQLFQLIFNFL